MRECQPRRERGEREREERERGESISAKIDGLDQRRFCVVESDDTHLGKLIMSCSVYVLGRGCVGTF